MRLPLLAVNEAQYSLDKSRQRASSSPLLWFGKAPPVPRLRCKGV